MNPNSSRSDELLKKGDENQSMEQPAIVASENVVNKEQRENAVPDILSSSITQEENMPEIDLKEHQKPASTISNETESAEKTIKTEPPNDDSNTTTLNISADQAAEVPNFQKGIIGVSAEYDGKRIDSLQNRLDTLDGHFKRLDGTVVNLTDFVTNTIKERIGSIEKTISSSIELHTQRLNKLEQTIEETDNAEKKSEQFFRNIDGLSNRIAELEQKVFELAKSHDMLMGMPATFQKFEGTFSDKIDGVNDKIETLSVRVLEVERQISNSQTILMELFREGAVKFENARKAKLEQLITQAQEKEQKALQEEQARLEIFSKEAKYWGEQGKKLTTEIKPLAASVIARIEASQKILNNLPNELQKEFRSSQDGLNIIGKMLERLINQPIDRERLNELATAIEFTESLKMIAENEWKQLIEEGTSGEALQKKIEKKLNAMSMQNYQTVSKLGEMAEKRKKKFLSFIETSILRVFDGVYDGQKHVKGLLETLQRKQPQKDGQLQIWFDTYSKLIQFLTGFLEKLG